MRRADIEAASAGSYLTYQDVRAMIAPEDVCAVLPSPPSAAMYAPTTSVTAPVLMVNGGIDPQDPPDMVAGAGRTYPNSLSLVSRNEAHGYADLSCRGGIIAAFVDRGSTVDLPSGCLDQIPAPPFDIR